MVERTATVVRVRADGDGVTAAADSPDLEAPFACDDDDGGDDRLAAVSVLSAAVDAPGEAKVAERTAVAGRVPRTDAGDCVCVCGANAIVEAPVVEAADENALASERVEGAARKLPANARLVGL